MSTKSYTLVPHRLQDHNIQSQWKSFFPYALRGQQSFEGQKTIISSRYGQHYHKFNLRQLSCKILILACVSSSLPLLTTEVMEHSQWIVLTTLRFPTIGYQKLYKL
jgi:hypothetical protein